MFEELYYFLCFVVFYLTKKMVLVFFDSFFQVREKYFFISQILKEFREKRERDTKTEDLFISRNAERTKEL